MNKVILRAIQIVLVGVGILLLVRIFAGCEQEHRHYTKKTSQEVKVYKQHKHHGLGTTTVNEDDDWIYWYIINYNNTYYYYSSPTYYSPAQYPTFQWSTSKANPIAEEEENNEINEVADQEIINTELGQQLDQTIESTEQEISNMENEGNPNTGDSESGTSESGGSSGGESSGDGGGGGGED